MKSQEPMTININSLVQNTLIAIFLCSAKAIIKALISLQAISEMVTEEHLAEGRLYPPLNTIREVSFKIAVKVSNRSHLLQEHVLLANSTFWHP